MLVVFLLLCLLAQGVIRFALLGLWKDRSGYKPCRDGTNQKREEDCSFHVAFLQP
jgi:hypothetical protein